MPPVHWRTGFLLSCALTALTAVAQTSFDRSLVVTPHRFEDSGAGTAVTVITRQQLRESGQSTLSGAIAETPGIHVAGTGGAGQQTSIFTRGTESNHTVVLVNGRRQSPGLAGGYDIANIPLDMVQRVEIMRGPAASLYGADTIGGVVNIITESGQGFEKPRTELAFEGGSFNTFREEAVSRGAFGPFDYALSAGRLDSTFQRDNSDYGRTSFRSQLGYDFSPTVRGGVQANHYRTEGGSPGSVFFGTPTASFDRQVWNVSPDFSWQCNEVWKQTLVLNYNREEQVYHIHPVVRNEIAIDTPQLDCTHEFQVTESWKLLAGVSSEYVKAVQTNVLGLRDIEETQDNHGIYLQSLWEILPGLSFGNNVRADRFSDYDAPVTWRNSLSYAPPGWGTQFHASAGTAYSPPSLQDLYFPGFNNPLLEPEESLGYEVGFSQQLFQRVEFGANVFRNEIENLIQFNGNIPVNVSSATTEGVESFVGAKITDTLRADLNHTYLNAQEDSGARLLRRPRNQCGATLRYQPVLPLTLNTGVLWVMGREDTSGRTFKRVDMPDYVTLRAGVMWEVQQHLTLWVRGENILDEQFEEVSGYPALDAAVYGGCRINF